MLKFNDVEIPQFCIVNDIKNSVLPTISQSTVKINNKAGVLDFGNQIGTRTIQVAITIIASDIQDLRAKVRELAQWLYYEEEKPLVILEESNIHYMAKFTGESTLNEILSIGKTTLNFVCLNEPFGIGEEKNYSFNPTVVEPYGFENNGNTNTFPRMEFTFTEATTHFSIISDNEQLLFGKPIDLQNEQPIDANPLVFNEGFSNLNGWTSGVTVDDGIITGGGFVSNGYSISVEDFGENPNGWHGASMIKALPYELQDFKIESRIGLLSTKPNQLGKIEVYGLDINGNVIFKQQFRDGVDTAIAPYALTKIGGKEVVGTYGDYVGVWKDFDDGYMNISRKGNVWEIYYAIYDSEKRVHHTRFRKEFIDVDNLYLTKLASIQIHIAQYKEYDVPRYMYIQHIRVFDENPIPAENELPFIFKVNDELIISNEDGGIFLNGQPFYQQLDPSSRFIKFEKGMNGLIMSPLVATGTVSYKERWL